MDAPPRSFAQPMTALSPLRLALAAIVVALFATAAPAMEWELSSLGETAIATLEGAPFPHAARAEGHKRGEAVFPADKHYNDSSVAFFIPVGYRPGDDVDLLLYFHGWNNNVRKAMDEFQLRQQVVRSGKNVILVFPQGPLDAPDSFGGKLEDEGGTARLTAQALDFLKSEGRIPAEAKLGRVVLSGHSGAYRIIHHTLRHGGLDANVSEVLLLDASYGGLEDFSAWAVAHPEGRLRSVFTAHLADENTELMKLLDAAGAEYLKAEDVDEASAIPDPADTRLFFLSTARRTHNQCVELLEPWLRATRLADR